MKIMTIAGARPNFMKMASIVEAIRRHNGAGSSPVIRHILVHTGQYYDESLSKCFFDELGLPRPDVNLEVGSGSHAQQTAEIKKILKIHGRYGLVTLHRSSNVDTKDALEPLIRCFQVISRDLFLVLPLHPRTKASLERFGLLEGFNNTEGISLIDPLGYLDFLNLLDSASMVLTDSGGIQEETTALGVPCITLRENTERPVTITMGTNYLVGTDPAGILATAREILSGKGKRGKIPPYWDGLSGERIVACLANIY